MTSTIEPTLNDNLNLNDNSTDSSVGSGLINKWSFNILEPSLNTCITGEIYNSNQFSDGKHILTSKIIDAYIVNTCIENDYIVLKTINSKYILSNVSNNFKDYINSLITTDKLDSNEYFLLLIYTTAKLVASLPVPVVVGIAITGNTFSGKGEDLFKTNFLGSQSKYEK